MMNGNLSDMVVYDVSSVHYENLPEYYFTNARFITVCMMNKCTMGHSSIAMPPVCDFKSTNHVKTNH